MTSDRDNVIRYRLERARNTLIEALIMAEVGSWHGCINRLYNACCYAVTALLPREGMESKRHTGVRSLFNQHFV